MVLPSKDKAAFLLSYAGAPAETVGEVRARGQRATPSSQAADGGGDRAGEVRHRGAGGAGAAEQPAEGQWPGPR